MYYVVQLPLTCPYLGLWLSFARNPSKDPTEGGFTWPKYESAQDTLVRFAVDDVAAELVSREVVDVECSI